MHTRRTGYLSIHIGCTLFMIGFFLMQPAKAKDRRLSTSTSTIGTCADQGLIGHEASEGKSRRA